LFVNALDETLNPPAAVSMSVKIRRALGWLKIVETARFEKVQGARLKEFLDLIREASAAELDSSQDENPREPSRTGRLHFRMLVAQYARKDTASDVKSGWKGRWRLLKAALRFARGKGKIPVLQSEFREVPFADVESFSRELPPEAEELFTRYFRVKIQGLHFCGPAFYEVPLAKGFQSLALMYPVVIWLARWLAVGEGVDRLSLDHLSRALAIADHHHGYSPALGTRTARHRIKQLSQLNDVSKLCAWYGGESRFAGKTAT
jgi:lysine-N-methylase